jgi:C-terminal processing protease CtpA/Prc
VKRTGQRQVLKHAFIATMQSGHRGVFERQNGNMGRVWDRSKQYAKMPKSYRLPIDELYSLRITDEYAKPEILNEVLKTAGDTFTANCEHELAYEMSKL